MVITHVRVFLLIALACFIVAFLIAVNAISGNAAAWTDAGLALFVAGHLLP